MRSTPHQPLTSHPLSHYPSPPYPSSPHLAVNDTVANASPLEDEPPTYLKEGDVVKMCV